jgi:hypothetical protein
MAFLSRQTSSADPPAPPAVEKRQFWTPEFVLVVTMLAVLTILVIYVLNLPIKITGATGEEVVVQTRDSLDHRQTILSLILTAFGAWVGAGAAYFFGRENLETAARSLLAMREPSPRERLRRTSIREVRPRPIDWTVTREETVASVVDKLTKSPERWYAVVVAADGKLDTVLHEEAIWRYVAESAQAGTAYADATAKKLGEMLEAMKDQPVAAANYVAVSLDQSAAEAHDSMLAKNVYLAIVTEPSGKPTHFITTGDLRRVLME